MKAMLAVFRRELLGLRKTPTALLFLFVFSALASLITLGQARLFDRGQADLAPLFDALPWLSLVLLPALSMGLFSEERRAGSIELLMTLPISIGDIVLGKFLAALLFAAFALLGTTPLWYAIASFGEPDHGAILATYIGALLLVGALLAIGTFVSSLTRSPASAFVGSIALGFAFLFSDIPAFDGMLPNALSFAARYESLARGVVGLDDVLFFVGTAVAFLCATGLVLVARQRNHAPKAMTAALLGHWTLLVFGLAPLAHGLQIDFTQGRLYSLSPATASIARDLQGPLTLTLYASDEAIETSPRFMGFTRFVEDRLHDLSRASRGKILIVKKNAAPFTTADDEARAAGLSHVQLGVAGGGRELVFGLIATNRGGDLRKLSFISPEAETELEHRLAQIILELNHPERTRIGVISSFTDAAPPGDLLTGGLSGRGWQVIEASRADFDYTKLGLPLSTVPAEIDVLWVLHPKKLDRMTLASIDRFAQSGGALLIQVDPLSEVDRTGMQSGSTAAGYVAERDSSLSALLGPWGLSLVKRRIVGDRKLGREIPAGSAGNTQPTTFPQWLRLGPDDFESSPYAKALFANLREINFASAGALVPSDVGEVELKQRPILRSTPDSMLIEASLVQVIKDPTSLMRDFVPSDERQVFGVELLGEAPAAFPGEAVENPSPMRAFVIADVDCATDALWVREDVPLAGTQTSNKTRSFSAVADNGVFITRLLGELAGGAQLALAGARRPGAHYTRPFTRFDRIKRAAEERLARELSSARSLEGELQGALATASENFAANGDSSSPDLAVNRLKDRLAKTRTALKGLLRERDREVRALKSQATYWCSLAWPILLGLLALFLHRRP